jgi:hypothetical protein
MGEARVVTTGDPERDLFHQYGHRFRVFVPAVWIRTAEHERLLRQAIESDKPAHTAYDLCLVEPRLRVEIQSTVGLDTLIGGYPKARLASACDDLTASGRAAGAVLGFDTLLACPGPKPLRLNGSVRADGGAVLA